MDGDVLVLYVIVILCVHGPPSYITVNSLTRLQIYSKIITGIKPFELTTPYTTKSMMKYHKIK